MNHCDVLQRRSSTISGADVEGVERPGVLAEMFCRPDVAGFSVDLKVWGSPLSFWKITEKVCISETQRWSLSNPHHCSELT